ncbi:MAG TPA: hypothetical protein VFY68_02575 [Nitrososphaeraceae archaeon]|nr:hypothetical protein [Nitrososphaeraceae archaeon]
MDDRKNNQFHHVISSQSQSNTYDKHSHWASSSSHPYKRPEATIYEDGSALDKLTFNAINYVRNPEIWLSACEWFHEPEYHETPDRIRQSTRKYGISCI